MHSIIKEQLDKYNLKESDNVGNAFAEVLQHAVLTCLAKVGFFKDAVFCGGTALRIFYKLSRFSEDLDFSLKYKNTKFNFEPYKKNLQRLLLSFDLECTFSQQDYKTNVKKLFVCFDVHDFIDKFSNKKFHQLFEPRRKIKIKIEIDTNPPKSACWEEKILDYPYFTLVCLNDLPTLFAGKLSAIITRPTYSLWTKGRDYYDYLFYLRNGIKPNYEYIRYSLSQQKLWDSKKEFKRDDLVKILTKTFKKVNIKSVIEDVLPFAKETQEILSLTNEMLIHSCELIK